MDAKKSTASHTLGRANYFLERAKACVRVDRAAFEHFLEAAIIYGRSITFHLQKEFAGAQGFDEWYGRKKAAMEGDPLFRFLKEKRNYVLKEGPVSIQKTSFLSMFETVNISDILEVQVIRGKPWYKRGIRILLADLRGTLIQSYRKWKYNRQVARQRKIIQRPHKTEMIEILHFEEPEWKERAATDLVQEYLYKLSILIAEAEKLFLI